MGQPRRSPDQAGGYLQAVQGQLWRLDLKAIVGSVLLGVLLTILAAVFERIDVALTGGAFVIFGAVNFYTFTAISTLFFRLPGGVITGLTNALISMATAASPMSPWFIPTNTVAPIVFGLVIWHLSMNKWWHHILANVLGIWISMLIIMWGLLVTIKLPLNIALVSYAVTSLAASIGAPILSVLIAKAVDRSRVLQ